MVPSKALLLFVVICCLAPERIISEFGQFHGASLSYVIINGTSGLEVQLDLIIGWVLGQGPCGLHCTRAAINSDTKLSRIEVFQKEGDSRYFGNWTVEYKMNGSRTVNYTDISQHVYNNTKETVLYVNELAGWEQDWTVFRFPTIPGARNMDFSFEGLSWRSLSLQGGNKAWHVQIRVSTELRSDTGKPNNSPQAFSKPFYRLLLGQVNYIRVSVIDPDGDLLFCRLSEFIEAGIVSTHPLPNVTVTEDCVISVSSDRSLGYHNGSWGAIGVSIRDYFDGISGTAVGVQFLVQFLDEINEPKFINPTPADNHRFNIYSGTTWKVDVYAEPVSPALIDRFSCIGRHHENLRILKVKVITVPGHTNVKMATVTWTPLESDIGEHIVCVDVEDTKGMDTSQQRCYRIAVKPFNIVNQPATVPADKPYFINIPQKDTLVCDVNATCIFPVHARTDVAGAQITSIWIGQNFLDLAENDTDVIRNGTGNGKMDIRISHSTDGTPSLCLYAQDSTGAISDETCINAKIIPPDPCGKRKCVHGACKRDPDNLNEYLCKCASDHYYGKFCEKEKDDCPMGRCGHGVCRDMAGPAFYCRCDRGWTGKLCDTYISHCTPGYCSGHGDCIDEPNGYHCDCFERYSGDNCTIDRCPSTYRDNKTCTMLGCQAGTCSNHGVCTDGAKCHCSLGYEGSVDCSIGRGDISSQQANFVEPTPRDGSIIMCYNSMPCQLSVFIAGGSSPEVWIRYVSDDLSNLMHSSGPSSVKFVPGMQNMLEASIQIDAPAPSTYFGHQYVCIEAYESGSNASGSSMRCYNIFYTNDPSATHKPQGDVGTYNYIKFHDPTTRGYSKFTCNMNETCHLFVYTNKDNTSKCREVTGTSAVHVQPVRTRETDCFTDVSYSFSEYGLHTVCLKADDTEGEKRCFTIDVPEPSSDPCLCQNMGGCLRYTNSTYKCICKKEYSGSYCEKGPCPTIDSVCKHGYCEANNTTQTCFCLFGYKGPTCMDVTLGGIMDPLMNGPAFADAFVPKEVMCIRRKPCTVPFIVSRSGLDQYGTVDVGYVSPSIHVDGIETERKASSTNGTYISEIRFTPNASGKQKVCIQTFNRDRVNIDELCFEVNVMTDFDDHQDKDKPYFVQPSITTDSTVACKSEMPCHLVFTVSSGNSSPKSCPKVKLVEGLKDFHIFTSCENCTDGLTAVENCTMDVVFNPARSDRGSHLICVEAGPVRYGLRGNERCFYLEVVNGSLDLGGPCKKLHCRNGGFCDAFNGGSERPVCHCSSVFSGAECETEEYSSITDNTNRFGNFALPVEIRCNINETCVVPLRILGQPPDTPTVEPGNVSSTIVIESLVINSADSMCTNYEGYIKLRPTANGTKEVCIQIKANRSAIRATEEVCFRVIVDGRFTRAPVDTSRPYYIHPTLPDGSTVMCQTGSSCHILLHTPTKNSKCSTVSEVTHYTNSLHIFSPVSRLGYDCVTDVSYIPLTTNEGQTERICLQASLPGFKGEVRCYDVVSISKVNVTRYDSFNGTSVGGVCHTTESSALWGFNAPLPTVAPAGYMAYTSGFKGNCHTWSRTTLPTWRRHCSIIQYPPFVPKEQTNSNNVTGCDEKKNTA